MTREPFHRAPSHGIDPCRTRCLTPATLSRDAAGQAPQRVALED